MTDQSLLPQGPCHLLQLPAELQLEIIKHIRQRRDLYHLSLTCHSLEDVSLNRLYRTISLDVPDRESFSQRGNVPPAFRPHILQNVRELSIRAGWVDVSQHACGRRHITNARVIERYFRAIIDGVAGDRLEAFNFFHPSPLSLQMVDGLSRQHGQNLRHLRCYELEAHDDGSDYSLPSRLYSFEDRSVLSGESATKLIAKNKETLTSLSLGQDRLLAQQYRKRRIGFLDHIPKLSENFYHALDLRTLPRLKSLALSGVDLQPLLPQTLQPLTRLAQLESLILQSCVNTAPFLDALASNFVNMQKRTSILEDRVVLKKFSFRHELLTNSVRDSLVDFLNSFSGLESLSVLVENTTFATRPAAFLMKHGRTLQTVVLESRIQPREHIQIDTSRPFGPSTIPLQQRWSETLNDITSLCPNLVELGLAIPWDDILQTTAASAAVKSLGTFKYLKTLHIRNFPSLQTYGQREEQTVRSCAEKFLREIYGSSMSGVPMCCPLETLAVGSNIYSSRWSESPFLASTQTQTQTQTQKSGVDSNSDRAPPSHSEVVSTIQHRQHYYHVSQNFSPASMSASLQNSVMANPEAKTETESEIHPVWIEKHEPLMTNVDEDHHNHDFHSPRLHHYLQTQYFAVAAMAAVTKSTAHFSLSPMNPHLVREMYSSHEADFCRESLWLR